MPPAGLAGADFVGADFAGLADLGVTGLGAAFATGFLITAGFAGTVLAAFLAAGLPAGRMVDLAGLEEACFTDALVATLAVDLAVDLMADLDTPGFEAEAFPIGFPGFPEAERVPDVLDAKRVFA